MGTDHQSCKSVLLRAEIERKLGHPETSLKIICGNLPKILQVLDLELYAKALLSISSSFIDIYNHHLSCGHYKLSHTCPKTLEYSYKLLNESINVFSKICDVANLAKSLAVYCKLLKFLNRDVEVKIVQDRLLSLYELRKSQRRHSPMVTSETMSIIKKLYFSPNEVRLSDDDLKKEVETLMEMIGCSKIRAIAV